VKADFTAEEIAAEIERIRKDKKAPGDYRGSVDPLMGPRFMS
jgi:hypothetical protein